MSDSLAKRRRQTSELGKEKWLRFVRSNTGGEVTVERESSRNVQRALLESFVEYPFGYIWEETTRDWEL